MTTDRKPPVISVDDLMHDIEDEVRRERRKRLLAHGGASDYRDAGVYESVDRVLRRALELRDREVLLLPDLVGGDDDWRLRLPLQFSSHRPIVGPMLLFVKRRLLLPVMRWLYEYSLENFRRQQRLNMILIASIESLAIENAQLRQTIAALQNCRITGSEEGTGGEKHER
jgi:hypothetical protein